MIIPITKIEECNAILGAGEKGVIDEIFARLKTMASDGKQLCDFMENSLRPAGVWTAWCNANLTATEKAWFVSRYLEVKAIVTAIE
jgi:hypothetical protein